MIIFKKKVLLYPKWMEYPFGSFGFNLIFLNHCPRYNGMALPFVFGNDWGWHHFMLTDW